VSQQEKAALEVEEALQTEEGPMLTAPDSGGSPKRAATLQATYFQAEDLALRAIQAEYGTTISRQVTAGRDIGFDGAFVTNGRLNIVEVKYVRSLKTIPRFQQTLERLASTVSRYGWKNVQIVLALVFERPEDVTPGTRHIEDIAAGLPLPVAIRSYGFADLQRRFGVSGVDETAG
jgi:hypothetical protein